MRIVMPFVVALVLVTGSGCAVFNRQNTPLLNGVEKHLVPKENPGRALSYPVVLPLGLAAVTLDMFLIHPLSVIPDSLRDTKDLLWTNLEWKKEYATTSATLIPRSAASPPVFAASFLARSFFDMEPRNSKAQQERLDAEKLRQEKARAHLDSAKSALEAKRWDEAVKQADEVHKVGVKLPEASTIKATAFLELRDAKGLYAIPRYFPLFDDATFYAHYVEHVTRGSSAEKMSLLNLLDNRHPKLDEVPGAAGSTATPLPALSDILAAMLNEEDRALRVKAMEILAKYRNGGRARTLLEAVRDGNDPVLAEAARGFLKNWD